MDSNTLGENNKMLPQYTCESPLHLVLGRKSLMDTYLIISYEMEKNSFVMTKKQL